VIAHAGGDIGDGGTGNRRLRGWQVFNDIDAVPQSGHWFVATDTSRSAMSASSPTMRSMSIALTPFDRELVEYVVAWVPYGGVAEDEVFVRFGMSAQRLSEYLRDILTRAKTCRNDLPDDLVALIARAEAVISPDRAVASVSTPRRGDRAASDDELLASVGQWRICRGVWRWHEL
jgi:hypothetical protein